LAGTLSGVARRLCVEYPGAINHILNRGDRRELIFKDDRDRKTFLETLAAVCVKTSWQVQAYVLMPDYFSISWLRRPSPTWSTA